MTRSDSVLFRHFFRGFFESELLSVRDQLATVFGTVAALLASFGLMVPVLFNHKYRMLNALPGPALYHEAALADKLMFVCISMDLTAIVTLLNWRALFPELRDFLILSPLPIRRVQLFRAKLLALLFFVTLLIISINVFPSFSLTAIMSGRWQQPSNSFLQIGSLFVACGSAGYFAFFALLTVHALLLNVLPTAWYSRSVGATQAALLILACAALPLLFWIPGLHAVIGAEPALLRQLPPLWFLGIGERILGTKDALFRELSVQGWSGLMLVIVSSISLYVLTYARGMQDVFRSSGKQQNTLAVKCLSRIRSAAVATPEESAILSFAFKSLMRSPLHKLLLAGIAGACLALVLDGFASLWIDKALHAHVVAETAMLSAACSAPLIVSYFLLSGLLFAFSIPIEIRANWIFRISEAHGRYWAISAAEKILLAVAVIPVSTLTVASLAGWIGLSRATEQGAFVLLMCLILLEILLWNWNRIPFTCPYLPGKRNIVQSAVLFGSALSVFAYIATGIELRISRSLPATVVLFAVLAASSVFMQMQRRKSWRNGLFLKFDEAPDPEVQTLELRGE